MGAERKFVTLSAHPFGVLIGSAVCELESRREGSPEFPVVPKNISDKGAHPANATKHISKSTTNIAVRSILRILKKLRVSRNALISIVVDIS